jgi:vancomycin permeability regulator SanA
MKYKKIKSLLNGVSFTECRTFDKADITNFVANDMMSDVLTIDDENFVLITSLTSEQVVRTADIVGARGILLVSNKQPGERMLSMAREFDISILGTSMRMFKTCYILGTALEAEGHRL